jgi:Immunoglobulin-like domain of bacterial spore germination/Sporulation and spore germination
MAVHTTPPVERHRAKAHRRPGATRTWLAVLAAGAVAALGACTPPDGGGATPSPTSSATETGPAQTVAVPAYYVIDTRAGLRLARETTEVETDDPVTTAVERMIAGPADPDYSTTWNPATQVLGISRQGETIVVNLSEDARTANVGSPGAALMIQQLVYTATDAAEEDTAPVQLLIEGEPAGELWGAVVWDEPVAREDPLNVRMLVQIDVPGEGADVTSPVAVSGDAAAFEANVPWKVLDADGAEVQAGFTLTSEGQTFAPFSFTVDLEPGTYTIVITEDDPSGGAGGTPMSDSKTVTVS